jgi:hypothetical protein
MQLSRILGAQVFHRVDSQAPDDRELTLHPGYFEQRALVRKLEESLGADSRFLR